MKEAGEWELEELSLLYEGRVNEIRVCEKTGEGGGKRYFRQRVRDHNTAKRLLDMTAPGAGMMRGALDIPCIGEENGVSFLFPYRESRPLKKFYQTCPEGKKTAARLILECMASPLPWPLLYLTLEQERIHMDAGGNIYFTCDWDLEKLDGKMAEKDCAGLLAEQVFILLKEEPGNAALMRLIQKKEERNAYSSLAALYQDIMLTITGKKRGWKEKIKGFLSGHKNGIYRFLLTAGITLALLGGVMLLSQLIFGDFIGFRLFSHPFDYIGTETLK